MGGDIGDGNPLREVVAEIDAEHAAKVEEAKASAECDEVSVSGGKSPWRKPSPVRGQAGGRRREPARRSDARRRAAGRAARRVLGHELHRNRDRGSRAERFRRRRRPARQGAARHALGQDGGADGVGLRVRRGATRNAARASGRAPRRRMAGRTPRDRGRRRRHRGDRLEPAGQRGRQAVLVMVRVREPRGMVRVLRELVCERVRVHRFGRGAQVLLLPHGRAVVQGRRPLAAGRQRAGAWDIVFFDWDGDGVSDHVGIVESCDGSTVRTIEGNSDDACRRSAYGVGSPFIMGYGACSF
ncbi:MAG: CHAP domain-containing protein [Eggerthella lenta]